MKHKPQVFTKSGPTKYVSVMKKLIVIALVLAVVIAFPCLVLGLHASGGAKIIFLVVAALVLVAYFVFYAFYALNVSMGTVLEIEVTDKVVHLITKRKTFTYDVKMGCVAVKAKGNRYVCTFETQDSRDKFIFYRRAPFTSFSDEGFTEEDIRRFYTRRGLVT